MLEHVWVELLVPGGKQGVGDIQPLAIQTAFTQFKSGQVNTKVTCAGQEKIRGNVKPLSIQAAVVQHDLYQLSKQCNYSNLVQKMSHDVVTTNFFVQSSSKGVLFMMTASMWYMLPGQNMKARAIKGAIMYISDAPEVCLHMHGI